MADESLTGFDAAAARRDGISDAAIAEFLSGRVGFDLDTARKDGVSDSQIVDFLAPPATPNAEEPEPPKPEPAPESRGTWAGDLKSGFYGTSQAMAATSAVRAGEEIESLKKRIELFEKGDDPNVPERFRNALRSRSDQVPGLKRQLAEAEDRQARATAEVAKDAQALKALPVNEPLQRFTEGNLGEILENPGAIARGLIGQSATAMVPLIVGTALGGVAGGAIAGGTVGVATGGGQEAVRVLQKHGVDATDPEAVRKALADPAIKAEVEKGFGTAQAIEGTVGAATGALGGVTVPGKTAAAAIAKNVGLQAVGQGSLSAGGEAAKQGIIEGEFHPGRIAAAGLGEALFAPADAAGAAFHNRGRAPTPQEVAKPVMEAPTVDAAIAAARQVVERPAIEEAAALTSEFGNRIEQDEAAILRLFGGLNDGVVERAPDGAWFYRNDNGKEWQLRPWDGVEREGTIPAALAAAQRAHYEQQGVRVVYFENDKAIPFDGAVDPAQPNTIFLSNDMSRNAAQVGAHEVGHLFESTVLPDGTNLGDLLHQQVAAGMTAEGRAYAERLFGPTAPKRDAFPEGPTGDSLHADAVTGHLIRELGADLGGEAPKFQTFMPRVLEAVEARYGIDAAKDVLQKLMAGIRQAMTTLRQFFFRADEGAEYGQPPTESQRWVSNLDEIHETLARMYAERFGTQAEKENSKLRTMRETVLRDRAVRAMEQAPAAEVPPPAMPEGFLEPLPEGRPGPAPGPAYTDALQKVRQYQRWLVELDQKRRTDAEASGKVRILRQVEAAILRKVNGVEDRLTGAAAGRLATVRSQVDALLNPVEDSRDMALVREALQRERQRMADAAAVGTPSPGMTRALQEPSRPSARVEGPIRGQAVMPTESPPFTPPVAPFTSPVPEQTLPAHVLPPAPMAIAEAAASLSAAVPEPQGSQFDRAVREERERLWAQDMGGRKRGLPHNERMVTDSARETVMRREAQPDLDWYLGNGLPQEAVREVARLYRREDSQTTREALDAAVDRWATLEELRGLRQFGDEDVATYDMLAAEGSKDPVIAEVFDRLDEYYTGRQKEQPGDQDIPFGAEATRTPQRAGGEAARQEAIGSRGPEDRSQPGSRGETPEAPDELGPAFSPRAPVARIAGDALAAPDADIKTLRQAAIDYYRVRLQGRTVTNPELGDITFTGRGRREMRYASANPDKLRVTTALPEVLRRGVLDGSTRDTKGRQDVVAYHRLVAPVEIGDSTAFVSVVVEERANGKLYYNHYVGSDEASLRAASAPGNETGASRPGEAPGAAGEGDGLNIGLSAPKGKGPAFSPRRTDTEPAGPTLIETREATADELGARQRQVDKERALLAMRGRKVAAKPQQAVDDTPLFGGDRQQTLFSPRAPDTPAFREWFSRSKIVDDDGKPLVMYRGDYRDTGPVYKKNKATSARFYFTTDPEVASSYAAGKFYADEARSDFEHWFLFDPPKGQRNKVDLVRQWYALTPEQREAVKDTLLRARRDEDGDGIVFGEPNGGIAPTSHWDYEVRQARGNWLQAAKSVWLESGAIFGEEHLFQDILTKAGLKAEYDNPNEGKPVVTPVFLSIQNPLDTTAMPRSLIAKLSVELARDRTRARVGGAWDKETTTPKQWLTELRAEMEKKDGDIVDVSDSYVWTSIPENVTKALQRFGYDGIDDRGAKGAPDSQSIAHRVVIAFEPSQIKSATGNKGTFDPEKANITFSPRADLARQIADARAETNTQPTDGQKEAGNYAKGRVTFHGLPFVMENPEGSIRRGVDAKGKAWEAKLPADYGYLSRTEGADGDHVDAYIGPDLASQRAWVIDQIDPKTGRFDEHKIVMGVPDWSAARDIYERAFSDGSGPERMGNAAQMSIDELKTWLADGDTTKPIREADTGISMSPRITGENRGRAYTDDQIRAFESVGRVPASRGLREAFAEFRQDLGKRLLRDVVDPYIGVKVRDPEGYLALRNANTTNGAADMFKRWGTLKLDGSTYRMDKETGGVINDLVRPLQGEAHDFLWWVAANRAERLKAEDRENLFSAEDIASLKKLNRGEVSFDYTVANGKTTRNREAVYLDALRKLETYNRNALDLAVESGLLKRGDVDEKWSNPFYVPFFRQTETDNSRSFVGPAISEGFVKQTAFKALKGGREKLNADLWQNAFGNWTHMIDAALSNRAATKVLDEAVKDGVATPISRQHYDNVLSRAEKAATVWVMKDGEQQYYRVEDPFTLKAITALEYVQSPGIGMKIGRTFKKALQLGVALDPLFQLRNLIRDTENSIGVSKISANFFKNLAQGFGQQDVGGALKNVARAVAGQELAEARLSRETADAVAGGATMRFTAGTDTGFRDTKISTYLDTPEKITAFWDYLKTVGRSYSDAISIGEGVNRLALYKQLRQEGVPHDAASFAARDLQDFTLKGAAPIVRGITELVPFLNAWMQGLYKVGRAAADADKNVPGAVAVGVAKRLALTIGTMAMLNMALDAIYADDEDFQNRQEYDRNSNFWFKVGKTEFRIPMGFEVAALSRMLAIAAETTYDKEMTVDRAKKSIAQIVGTNMALNPTPQAFKPIIDLFANESRTGAPIESKGLERLRPEQRYTLENTFFARALSDVLNRGQRAVLGDQSKSLSPVQIDYLAQAYGGWVATTALALADNAIRPFTSEPERPARNLLETVTRGMIATTPTSERSSGRYVSMLYKQGEAIEQAYNTYRELQKRARPEEAREYLEDNRDQILKHRLFERVIRVEGDLNEQIRAVTNSPALNGEQKRVRIMQLTALKNRAARSLFSPEATP